MPTHDIRQKTRSEETNQDKENTAMIFIDSIKKTKAYFYKIELNADNTQASYSHDIDKTTGVENDEDDSLVGFCQ